MKNEPVRHHHIPQFILRNFCYDEKEHLLFFDKASNRVLKKSTKELFMERNLYRDDNQDDRMRIEKDLGRFENEVSRILKEKILGKETITLTVAEEEKIKLFFAILGFRSKHTAYFFKEGLSEESKRYYSQFQNDADMHALWKRNLSYLVNCRSLSEVLEHEQVDSPFKTFMMRDTFGCFGMHLSFIRCSKEDEGFVVGDTCPVVEACIEPHGVRIVMYAVHPVSPDTVVLVVGNGADSIAREFAVFRPCILAIPSYDKQQGTVRYRVRKLHAEETRYVNDLIRKNAETGFAFKKRAT